MNRRRSETIRVAPMIDDSEVSRSSWASALRLRQVQRLVEDELQRLRAGLDRLPQHAKLECLAVARHCVKPREMAGNLHRHDVEHLPLDLLDGGARRVGKRVDLLGLPCRHDRACLRGSLVEVLECLRPGAGRIMLRRHAMLPKCDRRWPPAWLDQGWHRRVVRNRCLAPEPALRVGHEAETIPCHEYGKGVAGRMPASR
ncbi:MAG: hypothetical protein VB138_07505 [Burkholderia sp.]